MLILKALILLYLVIVFILSAFFITHKEEIVDEAKLGEKYDLIKNYIYQIFIFIAIMLPIVVPIVIIVSLFKRKE